MSAPQNPATVIVKNEFYPSGLREIDIWNYYQKNKNVLVRRTIGRNLLIFFAIGLNQTIVIRKMVNESMIRLSMTNYDSIISGRTLSLHSTMHNIEDFGIVDIDTDNFEKAKTATNEIYDYMLEASFVDNCKIRYTGKSSFHVIVNFKKSMYIDGIRKMLQEYITKSDLINRYTMQQKRKPGTVNLDIYASNKVNGGFITEGSLSTIGLRCIELSIKKLKVFSKEDAVIEIKKDSNLK